MNKLVMMMVTLMVTLFAVNASAFDPPAAPANGWYVVDQAGKLSDGQVQSLNQKIEQVSKTTKNEFAILVLKDMGGDNIEDVANVTFKKWGVGKRGLDNGCLIVISVQERKTRIETGKGVGGEVTDLQANNILKNTLAPHLKRGDYYSGLDSTLSALSSQIESRHNQKADPKPGPSCSVAAPGASTETDGSITILILLGGVGVAGWLLHRRSKRKKQEAAAVEAKFERERLLRLTLAAKQRDEEAAFKARREREESLRLATPMVQVPSIPPRSTVPPTTKPAVPRPTPKREVENNRSTVVAGAAAAAAVSATVAAQALQDKLRREREAREAREQEASRARQRARDEEDRRRRDREDDDRRRSSYSDSSSSSSGGWGGGSDSGGGFGGGDSGGGGSSGDF